MANGEPAFDIAGELSDKDGALVTAELESRKDRREFRKSAFALIKEMISIYLVALLFVLMGICLFAYKIIQVGKSPGLIFFGGALAIFAAIPLSLAMTMRHLATDTDDSKGDKRKQGSGDADIPVTTAQLGLMKAFFDLVTSGKKASS
ncbi:hypothetical protein ATCM_03920 [Stenotrophomonas sp. ATCM1_4]|uniref:hypothetical protein n=1 Tax=Stenotrophomonas sp. ATCM1_4 TaxID=2259330 RepID=UPI00104375BA|nr:hypothetical protein [Stenotrophomonas sp. ATCM1_4]TDB26863.1 hypothetical protein ATCM_03920 [Stenotrophomonas sp. ATCM1_4]